MATFTAFCRDDTGGITTWISTVEAPDVPGAIAAAINECAADWQKDPSSVQCVGIAAGDVQILHWDDEP